MWLSEYGKVVLTVGRDTDGYITCTIECDEDVFHFQGDDLHTLTRMALDAWQRRDAVEVEWEAGR